MNAGGGGFVVAWEFRVRAEAVAAFLRAYGPDGDWVALFRRGDGFVATELLADRAEPGRYVTLDRWRDEAAYRAFRERFAREYAALDAACEGWTTRETPLGAFRPEPPLPEEPA